MQGWGLELESGSVGVCVGVCGRVGVQRRVVGCVESVCENPLGSVGEKKLGLGRW